MHTIHPHKSRCPWCGEDPLYQRYHDEEWGKPVYDDETLFEFLVLESFQAGLSWITILRKRENFRNAFDHFDYRKIALYGPEKIESLMNDAGIVRNRLKIEATISNASRFMEIQQEYGSFSSFIWKYVDGQPVVNHPLSMKDLPASTTLSDKIAGDLKKRGFRFLGSTVMYAHMQATGMVNDHLANCWIRTAK